MRGKRALASVSPLNCPWYGLFLAFLFVWCVWNLLTRRFYQSSSLRHRRLRRRLRPAPRPHLKESQRRARRRRLCRGGGGSWLPPVARTPGRSEVVVVRGPPAALGHVRPAATAVEVAAAPGRARPISRGLNRGKRQQQYSVMKELRIVYLKWSS